MAKIMTQKLKLSELVTAIQETIQYQFEGESYWVSAQITNVKKYEGNRRCYLTLEEYEGTQKTAEIKAVFWSNTYSEIEKFERLTKQVFKNGIEIICRVKVRFHPVYGLNCDVLEIDAAHTVGSIELEKQKTIARLLTENPSTIQLFDGVFRTYNNRLPLPLVIKTIALITAPNSDGQRDFLQELQQNKHGYTFVIKEFLCTIQGDTAHELILQQLQAIEASGIPFDLVAIVRGGGSQTDFKPFDDYELARTVAAFPFPILTGIGHDRNQSIIDLMAREQKTPTKVATLIIDHNFEFENQIIQLKTNFFEAIKRQLQNASEQLKYAQRIVKLASPQTILQRGFAMVKKNNRIITNPEELMVDDEIETIFSKQTITSTIINKSKHEN